MYLCHVDHIYTHMMVVSYPAITLMLLFTIKLGGVEVIYTYSVLMCYEVSENVSMLMFLKKGWGIMSPDLHHDLYGVVFTYTSQVLVKLRPANSNGQ